MNGDSQKIYDAVVSNGNRLTAIEVLQQEQHKGNVRRISHIEWLIVFIFIAIFSPLIKKLIHICFM